MYGDRGAEYAQNEQHVNCVVGVYQNVGLYQNVGGCPSDREMRKVVGEGDRAKK